MNNKLTDHPLYLSGNQNPTSQNQRQENPEYFLDKTMHLKLQDLMVRG